MNYLNSILRLFAIALVVCCFLFSCINNQDSKVIMEIKINKINPINHNLKSVIVGEAIQNVFVISGDRKINMTKFEKTQIIYSHGVSRDGAYLLVCLGALSPKKALVYDIKTQKLISSFEPGFKEELLWTNRNNLIHSWGAGTGITCFAAYDINGKELYGGNTSGFEIDPTLRIYITYPIYGTFPSLDFAHRPLKIYDVETGKELYTSEPKLDVWEVKDILWEGDKKDKLTVLYYDSNKVEKKVQFILQD